MPDNPHLARPPHQVGAPLGRENPVVIAVHGRGGTAASMLDLMSALDWPDATVLAPQAAGQTWYPASFMAPFETNEPYLTYALDAYAHWVDGLTARGVDRSRIVLLGFSQGACLTAEFSLRNPARYGGLVILTGGAIGPPGTRWDAWTGSLEGTPTFLSSGDADPHVPLRRVRETVALLEARDAALTTVIYEGRPHTVSEDELERVRQMFFGSKGGPSRS